MVRFLLRIGVMVQVLHREEDDDTSLLTASCQEGIGRVSFDAGNSWPEPPI
jgi:hypothetical protein